MSSVIDEIREQERFEEKQETARRMFTAGKYSLEEIANISQLPLEEVKKLKNEKSA